MNSHYESYLKSEKMSENTIRAYVGHIGQALDYIGKADEDVTYLDLIDWKASISDLSSSTVALKVASIHSYFQFLKNAKIITEDPSEGIKRPEIKNKVKPYMTEDDVKAMIEAARTPRDRAMVRFLVSTGVRFVEMASITLDQYYTAINSNRVIVLKVTKGSKERGIYINESTEKAITEYLATRCDDCPYLFASFRRNKLSDNSVSQTIKNIGKRAGLPYWNDLSCHCMRAACATIMSDKGVPVATISSTLGHSSLEVTSRYIKNTQTNVNAAIQAMNF